MTEDDEWDALRGVIFNEYDMNLNSAGALARHILAAGFRRQRPVIDAEARYAALIAAARIKAEWRWPIPINYLPGDSEHTTLVALRHAYILGVGDAEGLGSKTASK